MYEPVNRDNVLEGAKLAFGQPVETRYDFEKADVIVSLDADFLYAGFPGNVRYIRDFAKRRNPDGNMNRLYVIESTPTTTGAKADHRLPLRRQQMSRLGACSLILQAMTAGHEGRAMSYARFPADASARLARSSRVEPRYRGRSSAASRSYAGSRNQPSWATSARLFSTPIQSMPTRSTKPSRSKISSPISHAGKVDLLVDPRRQSGLRRARRSRLRRRPKERQGSSACSSRALSERNR